MSDNNGTPAGTETTPPTAPAAEPIPTTPEPTVEAKFTQADLDRIVADRLNRERGKFADYDDLKNKASEYDKIRQSQMSDLEKATEALTAKDTELAAAQAELTELRVQAVRSAAATKAGLPAELHEFITATDPAEAEKQAQTLASKIAPAAPPAGSIPQGARPGAQAQPSANDWLRAQVFGR